MFNVVHLTGKENHPTLLNIQKWKEGIELVNLNISSFNHIDFIIIMFFHLIGVRIGDSEKQLLLNKKIIIIKISKSQSGNTK